MLYNTANQTISCSAGFNDTSVTSPPGKNDLI
jgi:hypothetical protein